MKKLSSFTCLLFFINYLYCQIPNSDMENWTTEPTLIGWETNSRPLTLPAWNPYVVVQDSDRYSGNWAANLIANGVFKAWAKTIFAVHTHPNHVSLYYKLLFAPCVNDSGYAEKTLFRF